MNADKRGLIHEELTEKVIKIFFDVYNELGHGFLESVYERAMEIALTHAGLQVRCQVRLRVMFRGETIAEFAADMMVNECVIVEFKATTALSSADEAQLLNQLRSTEIEVGLLMNFGTRPEFKRKVFANDRKPNLARRPNPPV